MLLLLGFEIEVLQRLIASYCIFYLQNANIAFRKAKSRVCRFPPHAPLSPSLRYWYTLFHALSAIMGMHLEFRAYKMYDVPNYIQSFYRIVIYTCTACHYLQMQRLHGSKGETSSCMFQVNIYESVLGFAFANLATPFRAASALCGFKFTANWNLSRPSFVHW